MEDETITVEGTETPAAGDGDESKPTESEVGNPEHVGEEGLVDHAEIAGEGGVEVGGEQIEGEQMEGEQMEGEQAEGEHDEGEHAEAEHAEGEHAEAEHAEGEHAEGEEKEKVLGEGEELMGEEMEGEQVEGEQKEQEVVEEEKVEEEEQFVEEPPPDPTAPYDFSDSKEALREPYALRPDQLAEVEQLWELYQNYTPAYTDIDNYITEKELFYMLQALILFPVTPEQFQELIEYCVRPPHPLGHINFDQFLKMVTLRQRDFPIEDELKKSFQVMDPDGTGVIEREYLKEVLLKQGHKMPQRQLDNFIKEVDMTNDGTIGIDDAVGTMCIDLNKEDLQMLHDTLYPPEEVADDE